jgi:hypothetical protein
MTRDEAIAHIGCMVKHFRQKTWHKGGVSAKIISVEKKYAVIKPSKHGKIERAKFRDLRIWKPGAKK